MPKQHFFFYPFPKNNCSSVVDGDMADWVAEMIAGDTKGVEAFTLDAMFLITERTRTSFKKHVEDKAEAYKKRLAVVGAQGIVGDTLYIVGHCDSGSSELYSPDEKVSCTADALVGYLAELPVDWPGRIKVLACESAKTGWFGASQSFAKRLHDKLRVKGYQCEVFGYSHSVASWYTSNSANTERHKYVDGKRSKDYLQKIQ